MKIFNYIYPALAAFGLWGFVFILALSGIPPFTWFAQIYLWSLAIIGTIIISVFTLSLKK